MLVTVKEAVVVGPTNDFGEIFTVVDNDADRANGVNGAELNGRGALALEAGAPDFGNIDLAGGDFNPERLQIDDDSGVFAGCRLAQRLMRRAARRCHRHRALRLRQLRDRADGGLCRRPAEHAGEGDHDAGRRCHRLTVASYNAENLDPTDGAARFATIAQEIVTNLKLPDIITLQEVQDNDGPGNAAGSTVTSASVTLQMLVDALNAAAPAGVEYAFIDNPFIGDDPMAARAAVTSARPSSIAPTGSIWSTSAQDAGGRRHGHLRSGRQHRPAHQP